jgi:hypothetical protein
MELMLDVVKDPALHRHASEGYKKVGQSIDLHGTEDQLICREAGTFWNEETTDKASSMRPKINVELAAVADEYASGGITWCERDVLRLIPPYPPRAQVDRILQNLGEDFYYDDVHCLTNGEDDTAVADGDEDAAEPSSDEDDGKDEASEQVLAADTCEDVDGAEIVHFVGSRGSSAPLSACEADAVHKAKSTMASLQATIENL